MMAIMFDPAARVPLADQFAELAIELKRYPDRDVFVECNGAQVWVTKAAEFKRLTKGRRVWKTYARK